MKILKKLLLGVTFAFAGITVGNAVVDIVNPEAVTYASTDFYGNKKISADADSSAEAKSFVSKLFAAANILAAIVLAISIIMIIIGGLRYIMSNGDSKQAEQGKMILLYSGIGIIIAISAFAIAKFFSSFAI